MSRLLLYLPYSFPLSVNKYNEVVHGGNIQAAFILLLLDLVLLCHYYIIYSWSYWPKSDL